MIHTGKGSAGRRLGWFAVPLVLLPLAACEAPPAGTGAFRNVAAVETLRRGVSGKPDVAAALGVPNGDGAALFPNLPAGQREIWYYEDMEATGTKSVGDVVRMTMRQQLLFVFFKGDVFDGYLWTSNTAPAASQ